MSLDPIVLQGSEGREFWWQRQSGLRTSFSQDQGVDLIIRQEGDHKGEVHCYANPGYVVLAVIARFHYEIFGRFPEIENYVALDGREDEERISGYLIQNALSQAIHNIDNKTILLSDQKNSEFVGSGASGHYFAAQRDGTLWLLSSKGNETDIRIMYERDGSREDVFGDENRSFYFKPEIILSPDELDLAVNAIYMLGPSPQRFRFLYSEVVDGLYSRKE